MVPSYTSHSSHGKKTLVQQGEETDSLWRVLRGGFRLDHYARRPEVKAQIDWLLKHPRYVYRLAQNARPYLYYIVKQLEGRQIPLELALMPMVESDYDPFAYSSAGAAGLWQMMPGTASGFGLKQNWWYDGRRDIVASTNAALDYLAYLQNFFNGNWLLAIAAYDTGEGSVLSATRKNIAKGMPTDFWSLPLARETQAYIPKLLALAEIISNPKKYAIQLPDVKNAPYLRSVDVGSQIDLKRAAQLSGISLDALLKLNPAYSRGVTAPDGPHTILLPIDKVPTFKANLLKLPQSDRVTWQRYTVQSGDTLSKIATQFDTTVPLLKQVNKLDSEMIHEEDVLFIPESKKMVAQQDKRPGPQKTVHIVKKGESLEAIAKKYEVKTSAIAFWNGLKKGDFLAPGRSLDLWLQEKTVPEEPKKEDLAQHFKASEPLQVKYSVQHGDTLDKIAYYFDTNMTLIRQLNALSSDVLTIGQSLSIIPHALPTIRKEKNIQPKQMVYIVEAGNSLAGIAQAFNVTVENILEWNSQLTEKSTLRSGEVLFLWQ